ncbi:hypothetical protein OS493_036434 [Desmophyllum pertusum]|uniref:TGF-beta family profile domain-containing protein n=1 Tax=Desmophyllum pertusum TaxID=174260 RepID=A0A9X0CNP9_9CNID|nr:hypothetical protein OS493_036434 [Desmophyllum pertusum]
MQENLQLSLDIAVKGTNSLEIDGGDVSGNGGPLHPFLAVDTEEKQQVNRQKRQVVDECPVTRPETCCRLHPFEVDVSDISWDFIIAPKTLNISACAGSCGSPRHAFYRSRNLTRAIAFNEMNMLKPQCCVPKRMGSLSLIYFDHNQAIQKTEFPNLKVLSCHCTF